MIIIIKISGWFVYIVFPCTEEGEEAITAESFEVAKPQPIYTDGGGAEVELECILITLEAGSSTSTIPLIKLQTSIHTCITGLHAKKLSVLGKLRLELASFNPRLAVWEPLLEPVEQPDNFGPPEHKPWALKFEVAMDQSSGEATRSPSLASIAGSPDKDEVDFEEYHLPDPVCTIELQAKVWQACIHVFVDYVMSYLSLYIKKTPKKKPNTQKKKKITELGLICSRNLLIGKFLVL
ncbi:Vacuolar protein sorting-associated protein 13 [Chionoecetes opilio]|uniref:Vacuolar protein sorting-associated protein 13 n=1 Tax=Chionoecetes opilio TaxID=41210 RepID=A0A8J4Y845_CHIOP|nr:Vacuolar protein sorting-associated protein 13 [Chionoecetes opilio]